MYRIVAQSKLGELIGLQRVLCPYLIVTAALAGLAVAPTAQAQTTWYVDDDAPNDPAPGDPTVSDPLEDGSADHPFDAIQEGIDAATDGDIVLVADGTYTGLGNKNLDYAGKAITIRSENGPETCVIDCEGDGPGVYFQAGETYASVLDGLAITSGWPGSENPGGGIRCESSSPTIIDCALTLNAAADGGGIFCGSSSSPVISGCTISLNMANRGAGVFCENASHPRIMRCLITGNSSMSSISGSGICCWDSSPAVVNCTVAGNRTLSAGGHSGILCLEGSAPTIANCLVTGNVAGLGVPSEPSTGIECRYSNPTIVDCTITRNVPMLAGFSFGIYCMSCNPTVANCVVWHHSASIVGPEDIQVAFSDIQGGWAGVGNIDIDPEFVDPDGADDDLDTWEDNDFHLVLGSPCVDAGCNCAVAEDFADLDGDGVLWEYVPFDLDGEGRFFDDPDTPDSGSGVPPIVDMGAYEFGGSDLPPCHGDLDGDRDVDLEDLAVLLAHYGMSEGANGADGDMDCDGDIELSDLADFLGAYGDVCE